MTTAIESPRLEATLQELLLSIDDGHTCIDLRAADSDPRAQLLGSGLATEVEATATAAAGSSADPHDDLPSSPLVLAGDRLYLRRHYAAERRVAARLRAQVLAEPPAVADSSLARLRELAPNGKPDYQIAACAAALRSRLCVITGGPGTGKTTTVRTLLEVLRAGEPDLQQALVAPTGKAAARMAEATDPDADAAQHRPATTLHRLLGYLPREDMFRRSPSSPLPHDLVVMDEASMVDLELMDALLAALKPGARLLLLGDRDQLPSVGAGQVFADLCSTVPAGHGIGPGLGAFCRQQLGMDLPTVDVAGPFADAVVELQQNYRFGDQPGIGAFAAAISQRQPAAALAALQAGHDDLELFAPGDLDSVLAAWWPRIEQQLAASTPEQALAQLSTARVVCALRHGPFGVEAISSRVESLLLAHGHRRSGPFYRGQPLLITANDHQHNLFNGDLGVVWPDDEGRLVVWFDGRGSTPRAVLPLQLPPHETAWAITVHKSQGSEFDEVLVLLPDRDSPLLHRQLIYTAATRARLGAAIVAEPKLLARALSTEPQRTSGLLEALLEQSG